MGTGDDKKPFQVNLERKKRDERERVIGREGVGERERCGRERDTHDSKGEKESCGRECDRVREREMQKRKGHRRERLGLESALKEHASLFRLSFFFLGGTYMRDEDAHPGPLPILALILPKGGTTKDKGLGPT